MRLIFSACVLFGVLVSNFNGAVVFRFTNFVCLSYNESWFRFNNCRLKAVSRDKIIMNANGTVLHEANKIHVHLKMFKKASGYKPWLIDTKIDICRFLRKNYHPYGKIVFNLVKDFSNFNHSCPYVGHQIIQGFYLRPELVALPWPTGEYMLAIRWFFDLKLQFDTNASFVFIEDLRKS